MLRIRKAQNEELARRVFRAKLYRFLCKVLPANLRERMGGLAGVSALWSKVEWPPGSSEHDVAVYMTFVWLASFDAEAAKRLLPPTELRHTPGVIFAMKSYMVDAGLFDICAFDAV